jgi:hypothetical protein
MDVDEFVSQPGPTVPRFRTAEWMHQDLHRFLKNLLWARKETQDKKEGLSKVLASL